VPTCLLQDVRDLRLLLAQGNVAAAETQPDKIDTTLTNALTTRGALDQARSQVVEQNTRA
jgi:hypothetical protein